MTANPMTNRAPSRHRWRIMVMFFLFLLLHQSDKLLIGPLMKPIIGLAATRSSGSSII